MPFDLSTAKPVTEASGFDLSTAKPVAAGPDGMPEYHDQTYDSSEYVPKDESRMGRIARLAKKAWKEASDEPAMGGALPMPQSVGKGILEAGAQMATGALAAPIAGIAGLVQGAKNLITGKTDTSAADRVQETQHAMTYEPKTSAGKLISELAAAPISIASQAAGEHLGQTLKEDAGTWGGLIGGKEGRQKGEALGENVGQTIGEAAIPAGMALAGGLSARSAARKTPETISPKSMAEESALKARESGYVIPPNNLLTGYGGMAKTEQLASVKNQVVTNAKAAREIGLPEATELTESTLKNLKAEYGKPYAEVSKLGDLEITGVKDLPKDLKIDKNRDPMRGRGEIVTVDAADLVKQWKQSNFEAKGYQNAFARDANPETLAKAKSAQADAAQMERMIRKVAQEKGTPELVDALKEARVKLAKVYNVESATNPVTGNVDAAKLARSKYLSGELKDIANFQKLAKKSARTPESYGAMSDISPLDVGVAGIEAAGALSAGKPGIAAAALGAVTGRPIARRYSLSDAYQKRMTQDVSGRNSEALGKTAPIWAIGAEQSEEEQRKAAQ